jgi:hypothetical protein
MGLYCCQINFQPMVANGRLGNSLKVMWTDLTKGKLTNLSVNWQRIWLKRLQYLKISISPHAFIKIQSTTTWRWFELLGLTHMRISTHTVICADTRVNVSNFGLCNNKDLEIDNLDQSVERQKIYQQILSKAADVDPHKQHVSSNRLRWIKWKQEKIYSLATPDDLFTNHDSNLRLYTPHLPRFEDNLSVRARKTNNCPPFSKTIRSNITKELKEERNERDIPC